MVGPLAAEPVGGGKPVKVLEIGLAGVRHGKCGHLVHDRVRPAVATASPTDTASSPSITTPSAPNCSSNPSLPGPVVVAVTWWPRATDEQLSRDLSIGVALRRETRDLPLLWRELAQGIDTSSVSVLARRLQLDPRALRETLHPEVREEPVGDSQFLPCVHSSAFASQPLAVDQVGSGQIDGDPSSAKSIDRLDIGAGFRRGEEPDCVVEGARLELRLSRGHRSVRAAQTKFQWVTDGTYQAAFLTTPEGVVLFDAPPAIGTTCSGPSTRSPPPTASATG
jgi:hypothetical protein